MPQQNTNYLKIVENIGSVIVFYKTQKKINEYKLNKNSIPTHLIRYEIPEEINTKIEKRQVEGEIASKFGDDVVNFTNTLIKQFPEETLNNFYHNINSLNMRYKNFKIENLLYNTHTIGDYSIKNNRLSIDTEEGLEALPHELFHMASSRFSERLSLSGFEQTSLKLNINIGRGINEGYTQLLTERYFNEYVTSNIYPYEKKIMAEIEEIVGKEQLEKLYLNSNLPGLIRILEKYNEKDNILNFISSIDFLNQNIYKTKANKKTQEAVFNHIERVNNFFIDTYANKLITEYKEKTLPKEEYSKKLEDYTMSHGYVTLAGNYRYTVPSTERLYEKIEKLDNKFNTIVENMESKNK